jgi:hypothetical protein
MGIRDSGYPGSYPAGTRVVKIPGFESILFNTEPKIRELPVWSTAILFPVSVDIVLHHLKPEDISANDIWSRDIRNAHVALATSDYIAIVSKYNIISGIYALLVFPVVIDNRQLRHFVKQSPRVKVMKPRHFVYHRSRVTVGEVA